MATTVREAVKAALEADVTLMAFLTGGVYDRREISRTLTPDAYDARGELLPCGLVTVGTTTPEGPHFFDFERVYFQVYLYEEAGNHYAAIDEAKDRVRALLHRQRVVTEPSVVWEMRYADGLGDAFDEVLGAEMTYERFWAWRWRAT